MNLNDELTIEDDGTLGPWPGPVCPKTLLHITREKKMELSEEITAYICDAVKETPKRFINKDKTPMTPFEALASLVEPVAKIEAVVEAARIARFYAKSGWYEDKEKVFNELDKALKALDELEKENVSP